MTTYCTAKTEKGFTVQLFFLRDARLKSSDFIPLRLIFDPQTQSPPTPIPSHEIFC
jgi:hypothetical protein